MGVHGLWRLIEPSGKPVPLEALENKVLGVDISIWLHQAVKGFQDSKGASVPNAHLLGIFHRLCKLLYFRIKPVFVFDGGVPALKKQTIAKRNQLKSNRTAETVRIQKQLIQTLLKHSAVNNVITETVKSNLEKNTKKEPNLFELPQPEEEEEEDELSSGGDSESESSSPTRSYDIHSIDEKSENFKSLPVDIRHEILTELKETRKQNSWGRIHELPTKSDDFSGYQMRRLLKRYSIQVSLEEAEKEMGGASLSLGELEGLLKDHGVVTSKEIGSRIASDENKRFLFIKSVKKAMHEAKDQKKEVLETKEKEVLETKEKDVLETKETASIAEQEFERDLSKAIQLSLQEEPSTSSGIFDNANVNHHFFSTDDSDDYSSDDSDSPVSENNLLTETNNLISAKNYMTEYSGLTPAEISKIMSGKQTSPPKNEVITNNVEKVVPEKFDPFKKPDLSKLLPKKIDQIPKTDVDKSKISDDSDSDSDLVEVTSNGNETQEMDIDKPTEAFQITINKEANLDDSNDIFSDVFTEQQELETVSELETSKDNEMEKSKTEDAMKEQNGAIMNTSNIANVRVEDKEPEKEQNGILLNEVLDMVETKGKSEPLKEEELKTIASKLSSEKDSLLAKQSLKERLATNINEQMRTEAQELLRLFGIPYIIAPMEAEAQCAYLEEINLTEGTITDDSDVWLFGGKTVYKNFFNQTKRVLEYKAESIEKSFKLTRNEMILLALLVGSDYTTGVRGIGPVTALEILGYFPIRGKALNSDSDLISGLTEFKRWIGGEYNLKGRATLRSKLKKVVLSEQFPSLQVVKAYLEPTIEASNEAFSWGKPDMITLVDYAKEKFGWNQKKSEEILKPVFKSLKQNDSQTKITKYMKTKHKIDGSAVEEKLSKRVKLAIDQIGNQSNPSEGIDKPTKQKSKNVKPLDEDLKVLEKTKRVSRKRAKQIENELRYEMEQKQLAAQTRREDPIKKRLYATDVIPQKRMEKAAALRVKMKAIETFRKSKDGPGYVKKKVKKPNVQRDDSYLSEESD